MNDESIRPYSDPNQAGAVDEKGVEWWACDPYPTWYRWKEGKLYTRASAPRSARLAALGGEDQ